MIGLGACGSSGSHAGGIEDGAVIDVPSAEVEFRPVIEIAPPSTGGCAAPEGDESAATVTECTTGGFISYRVGAVTVDNGGIVGAQATPSASGGGWVVNPIFAETPTGLDAFNALAGECYRNAPQCPTGQIAIVVDGHVVAAPTMMSPAQFKADEVQISGNFTEDQAVRLAGGMSPG